MTRGVFVLVGCGAAKRDEPAEARDLYTSTYFDLKRQYAEAATQWARTNAKRANAWAVLSAEYSVVPSRLEIEPYDTTIGDLRGEPVEGEPTHTRPDGEPVETKLDAWANRVYGRLADWLRRPFRADQEESPCRELVVLAGSDYVDALRDRDVFDGQRIGVRTGTPDRYKALPPKATVRSPFQESDFAGNGEQMAWLSERVDDLRAEAAPARPDTLGSYGGGYERERATWQLDRPAVNVEGTEQAELGAFDDPPEKYIAKEQTSLPVATLDGGESEG